MADLAAARGSLPAFAAMVGCPLEPGHERGHPQRDRSGVWPVRAWPVFMSTGRGAGLERIVDALESLLPTEKA